MENYVNWICHGEYAVPNNSPESSETVEMNPNLGIDLDASNEWSVESDEFMNFVQDGDKPLYPGCTKATKMNGLIQTFNLKAKHGLTESCYTDMLLLFHALLPDGNEMPSSTNSAKKCLSALGMKYEKIDACPNDCILYRGLNETATKCPSCNASRWKLGKDNSDRVGVSAKSLWYFPPIPRFRRLFQSTISSKELTWHSTGRKIDGLMRHPADSPTWKMVDSKWPEFGLEPRNLRLTLSSDGFNPFGILSSTYSCWPVIMVIYNLPPWLCMKRKYMMLTLLISGPKQPGNDIDVYLQPLIDDLKVLWDEGIERVYDSVRGEYFRLRAVLLWTINDFPAYGNLSGSIVKGYNACPICVDQTKPVRLKYSKKMSFIRTRRWTVRNHPYRKQASAFDNTIEKEEAPQPLSGEELYERVKFLPKASGKGNKSVPYNGPPEYRPCWKKRSVFF
jgi:hypothetical protein